MRARPHHAIDYLGTVVLSLAVTSVILLTSLDGADPAQPALGRKQDRPKYVTGDHHKTITCSDLWQ
jgi:hypothetical protein